MKISTRMAALVCAAFLSPAALAQVTVKDAWVRGTVAQQKTTGAFMQITASEAARLVAISTPAAGIVEIHEMKMTDGVMKMRAVGGIDLPAGRTVALKPGGYHVMLMDLKQPLAGGTTVPLTLTLETRAGTRSTVEVQASVRALAGAAAAGKQDAGGHHHNGH